MKRTIAVILSILLLGTFLIGCASEKRIKKAIESVERYQYPIDVTSEDWFEYTVAEKSNMLLIPQETLDDMTDLQLLFATADYPYFCDASIYGFNKDGFDTFSKYCSAFHELQSRKSFLKTLKTYGKPVALLYLSDPNNTLDIARADLILGMMEVYLGSRPNVVAENGSYFIK